MKLKKTIQNILYPFEENKLNSFITSKVDLDDPTPIYVFFHIYAANHWKDIVSELMTDLRLSGLYERMIALHVTVISHNNNDIKYIKEQIGEKGIINYVTTEPKEFEYPALELLHSFSKEKPSFYALYFHTKGSSNSKKTIHEYGPKARSLNKLIRLSTSTRKFMSYWNIKRWKTAVSSLQNGYSTYGCNYYYICDNTQFYGGNFWWAKSSYIAALPSFNENKKKSRYYAECWLLENSTAKIYNAYRVNCGANGIEIPFNMYGGKGINKLYAVLIAYKNHMIYSIKKVYKRHH